MYPVIQTNALTFYYHVRLNFTTVRCGLKGSHDYRYTTSATHIYTLGENCVSTSYVLYHYHCIVLKQPWPFIIEP